MAERGYTPVSVVPLFKNKRLSAGDSGTSDLIDLRYIAQNGFFSLSQVTMAGTYGSAGTTVFTYTESSTVDGVFRTPLSAVAIGTASTAGTSGTTIFTFEPELAAFMKIVATQTGTGTAGADSLIKSAELMVQ
jgi:hypothetical protein